MQTKFKSQKAAILTALISGKTLTTLEAVREFGTVKLPTRIGEYEKELQFYCDREKHDFTTRYGTAGDYFSYKLDLRKNEQGIKNILEYLKENNELSIIPAGAKTDKENRKHRPPQPVPPPTATLFT